jgi:hypothetical protein
MLGKNEWEYDERYERQAREQSRQGSFPSAGLVVNENGIVRSVNVDRVHGIVLWFPLLIFLPFLFGNFGTNPRENLFDGGKLFVVRVPFLWCRVLFGNLFAVFIKPNERIAFIRKIPGINFFKGNRHFLILHSL